MVYRPNSRPEKCFNSSECLTVQRATIVWAGPRYLMYNTKSEHLLTYADCPHAFNTPPVSLSDVEFYYTGIFDYYLFSRMLSLSLVGIYLNTHTLFTCPGDITNWFLYGGGLKNWLHTDYPWVKHATLFPCCVYVRLREGGGIRARMQNSEHITIDMWTIMKFATTWLLSLEQLSWVQFFEQVMCTSPPRKLCVIACNCMY